MNRKLSVLVGALALVGTTTGSASAAGAEHAFYTEDYDAYEHLAADENFCGDWATTFHEVRTGGYRLLLPPGGREEGEIHVNGAIDGLVELIPDDTSLPTYAGTYREKLDGVITSFTENEDVERVASFRLRSTLQGTDGSTLELRLSGHYTENANGVVTASRENFTCE